MPVPWIRHGRQGVFLFKARSLLQEQTTPVGTLVFDRVASVSQVLAPGGWVSYAWDCRESISTYLY